MRYPYNRFADFVRELEREGELFRVSAPVDPRLEITEIANRCVKRGGPALLFENPAGCSMPLAIGCFASGKRMRMALGGREPQEIGEELASLLTPGSVRDVTRAITSLSNVKRLLSARTKRTGNAPCREVEVDPPDLFSLPVQKCWPDDGGRFFTWPTVVTRSPDTGARNVGTYRMQLLGRDSTALQFQIHRDGREHLRQAAERGEELPVAVALGPDPATMFAGVCPLPEGVDELAFAGYIRGRSCLTTPACNGALEPPGGCEVLLEGYIRPGETVDEGPFGDHFGFYCTVEKHPVFHVTRMSRRRDAVYPGNIVGPPPMEDGWVGEAINKMFEPLVRVQLPDILSLHTPLESGFHNLAVIAVKGGYPRRAVKAMLGLLGTGALSLTKCVVAVAEDVNTRELSAVARAVSANCDPSEDLHVIPSAPLDALDFSSGAPFVGGKLLLDATTKRRPSPPPPQADLSSLHLLSWHQPGGLLFIRRKPGAEPWTLARRAGELSKCRFVAVCEEDTDVADTTELLWRSLARFDPGRDVRVEEGRALFDMTHKTDRGEWPRPISMDDDTVAKVDERWSEYGIPS